MEKQINSTADRSHGVPKLRFPEFNENGNGRSCRNWRKKSILLNKIATMKSTEINSFFPYLDR